MKVTLELLEKYNAGAEGKTFMQKYYPDGADAFDIMDNPNLTKEMMHFARTYFRLDERDIQKYEEKCNIKNSEKVYFSSDIINSKVISCSNFIQDSQYIYDSINVNNCYGIYGSKDLENSTDCGFSKKVKYSALVLFSNEIARSQTILHSNFISWSSIITNSMIVQDSSFLYNCNNVIDCHFSGFLKNCKHCLFCSNLEDKEYYIFNRPVKQFEYEQILEQLNFRLEDERPTFIQINRDTKEFGRRFTYSNRLDSIFNGLSDDFFGWIGTIPYYNELVFLSIFFRDAK